MLLILNRGAEWYNPVLYILRYIGFSSSHQGRETSNFVSGSPPLASSLVRKSPPPAQLHHQSSHGDIACDSLAIGANVMGFLLPPNYLLLLPPLHPQTKWFSSLHWLRSSLYMQENAVVKRWSHNMDHTPEDGGKLFFLHKITACRQKAGTVRKELGGTMNIFQNVTQ